MHSSATRRGAAAPSPSRNRRLLAVFAGLVVLGGTFAVTQLASAEDNGTAACAETVSTKSARTKGFRNVHRDHRQGTRFTRPGSRPGGQAPGGQAPGGQAPGGQQGEEAPEGQNGGQQGEEAPEGQNPEGQAPEEEAPAAPPEDCDEEEGNQNAGGQNGGQAGGNGNTNGLDVLGQNCQGSGLQPHTGFQEAPRCVNIGMGEVSNENQNPSLLITESPRQVNVNQPFTLEVSTRNLVRDRFLGAAAGGYYLESSFLNNQGLQRGHFHAACRMLQNNNEAPNPEPAPAFFRAVEDGGGGGQPDTVTVEVTGMPQRGTAQCAVWAGDGSHRVPMMQRANQTPAFDVVRVRVN